MYFATYRGFGNFVNPIYGCPYYENFFLGTFIISDGKIQEYYEYMNPCVMVKQFGIEVPRIKRPKRTYFYEQGEV